MPGSSNLLPLANLTVRFHTETDARKPRDCTNYCSFSTYPAIDFSKTQEQTRNRAVLPGVSGPAQNPAPVQ